MERNRGRQPLLRSRDGYSTFSERAHGLSAGHKFPVGTGIITGIIEGRRFVHYNFSSYLQIVEGDFI